MSRRACIGLVGALVSLALVALFINSADQMRLTADSSGHLHWRYQLLIVTFVVLNPVLALVALASRPCQERSLRPGPGRSLLAPSIWRVLSEAGGSSQESSTRSCPGRVVPPDTRVRRTRVLLPAVPPLAADARSVGNERIIEVNHG